MVIRTVSVSSTTHSHCGTSTDDATVPELPVLVVPTQCQLLQQRLMPQLAQLPLQPQSYPSYPQQQQQQQQRVMVIRSGKSPTTISRMMQMRHIRLLYSDKRWILILIVALTVHVSFGFGVVGVGTTTTSSTSATTVSGARSVPHTDQEHLVLGRATQAQLKTTPSTKLKRSDEAEATIEAQLQIPISQTTKTNAKARTTTTTIPASPPEPIARYARILTPLSALMSLWWGAPFSSSAAIAVESSSAGQPQQPVVGGWTQQRLPMAQPQNQLKSRTIPPTRGTASATAVSSQSTTTKTKTSTTSTSSSSSSSLFEMAVQNYFPGAQSSSMVAQRVVTTLATRRKYQSSNTIMGSSLCSDEINETPNSLMNQILLQQQQQQQQQQQLIAAARRTTTSNTNAKESTTATISNQRSTTGSTGVFHLGGLGGLPFVGTSGMAAFLHHVPDHGKVLLVFGPHVGISERGQLGTLLRPGRTEETPTCGAAMAAYQAILRHTDSGSDSGAATSATTSSRTATKPKTTTRRNVRFDFQEEYIIDQLKSKLQNLAGKEAKGGDETIALVTNKMYELIWDLMKLELDSVTKTNSDFWNEISEITLLGGILINRNAQYGEDYFQPLMMKSMTAKGEVSLFNDVFKRAI